jgi:hypothetical protein
MQTNPQAEATLDPTYRFTPRELERLAIYRAAIAAEFYTDRCEPISLASRRRESVWRIPPAA